MVHVDVMNTNSDILNNILKLMDYGNFLLIYLMVF